MSSMMETLFIIISVIEFITGILGNGLTVLGNSIDGIRNQKNQMLSFDILWIGSNCFCMICTTCFNVFYFLKIAKFSNPIFPWMKWKIHKVHPIIVLEMIMVFIIFFIMSLICLLLLILSLWSRMRPVKLQGTYSRDFSSEAHERATKARISFLLLFIMYYLTK
nr:taste receptor type 2 member 8-like [Neomonachus schauinslandi]